MQAAHHNTLAVRQKHLKRQLLGIPKIQVKLWQQLLAKPMPFRPKDH